MGILDKALKYKKEMNKKGQQTLIVEIAGPAETEMAPSTEDYEDISDRVKTENEKEIIIRQLQKSISEVKVLSGLLPICASCKKIRDVKGYWKQIETYISQHTDVGFTHGQCPDCMDKMYSGQEWYESGKQKGKF